MEYEDVIKLNLDQPTSDDDDAAAALRMGEIWRVPGERNSHFTGRDAALTAIEKHFKQPGHTRRVQAVVGLGGIGKTQLAAEYAWRHRKEYAIVWWLPSDDPTTLALAYSQLAKRMQLRLPKPDNLDATRHMLRRVLGKRRDWLLIFDNAPSAETIENYLPLNHSGHVLITSRDGEWDGVAKVYPLRPMERAESVDFLMRRAGRRGEEPIAHMVAKALGDHPLAMEQAGAQVAETRINFATYLKRFESHWAELLAEGTGRITPGGEYPDSLAMSLEISFRQLEETQPEAIALLNLVAFFGGESIPQWLLETAASIGEAIPLQLLPLLTETQNRDDAVAALRRYSLVDGDAGDVHVHRLVSALARRRLSTVEQAELATMSLQIVSAAFQFNSQDPQTWPACFQLLPHVLAVAAHAESLGVDPPVTAKVLNLAGQALMKQDRLPEARNALERALELGQQVYGPNNPRLAGMSNDLGRVMQKLGDAVAAREYYEKSLRIDEKIYGEDDAHAASVINNYAMTLHGDGDFAAARAHLERALVANEKQYGMDHRRVALVRNNLACVLRDSGDAAQAKEQFEIALTSARTACGETHPIVASIAFNLGEFLRLRGDAISAHPLLELALRVDRYNYGPVHPNVARDLTELATVCRALGEADTATQLEREAFATLAAAKNIA